MRLNITWDETVTRSGGIDVDDDKLTAAGVDLDDMEAVQAWLNRNTSAWSDQADEGWDEGGPVDREVCCVELDHD